MKRILFSLLSVIFLWSGFAFVPQLCAGVGDNNPTGVSGMFNGQVTTAGSYDPYTGNAHRVVTDIVVAGTAGEYPLALTRTSNSRDVAGNKFGSPGSWRHNYQWTIQNVSTWHHDMYYTVNFPDGRIETFIYSAADVDYRAAPGVRERLEPWTTINGTTGFCYLVLPDGGKVEFYGTRTLMTDPELIPPNWYEFTFVATAIIDPYGQRTTLTYDSNDPPRLSKVTEPAGRYLLFTYRTTAGQTHIIEKITASEGRIVDYVYGNIAPGGATYLALNSIIYYGNTAWTAHYTYVAPNCAGNWGGVPILKTADDPMYAGPMHKIGYVYKTGTNPDGTAAECGQILSENYYNGMSIGAAVSTLEITTATTRKETRGDSKTRTFTYGTTGFLNSNTDFMAHGASQTYDVNKYINSVTDRNGHQTNYTRNALTGSMTVTTFPLTPNDTQPPQSVRSTIQYTYGSPSCADSNNRDDDNPYYVCTAKDEATHVTQFWRDTNKRVTKIDYPDGGYETFTYNSFGQVLSHRMTTGGIESFTYDSRGLKLTYRNPSNPSPGNPTASYQYDAYDRVSVVTDALGSPTNFAYNLRGQVTVTTLPTDPVDGIRHTIVNTYNPNGTLLSRKNELNHTTSFTYDEYKRVKTVTTPLRFTGDTTNHTTSFYYNATGADPEDYKYADSNVTYVTVPSGKRIKASYDDNRRKISVTTGFNTADDATTGYTYDNVGNLTLVTDPLGHITTTDYDERNRPSSITRNWSLTTTFKYDLSGRKYSETRPNDQVITYVSYDAMNRLLELNVSQYPEPVAVTKYTYTPAGLLATMQDPRLVALNSSYNYKYEYDTTGRKTEVTYPPDSAGEQRIERFTYDTAGRLQTFKNRNGKVQTSTYDALNRMTGFTWNDGLTPNATFGYDVGSRLITINNANASISREYFNDNLLNSETETITGAVARTVSYTYDEDGNRDSLGFPPGYSFTYDYTGRNQLKNIVSGATTLATFGYDLNGNLATRDLNNSTNSIYLHDGFDRVTWVTHYLNGGTRTIDYGYESDSHNLKYVKRLISPASPETNKGEVFDYDQADQVIGVKLNVLNPDTFGPISQTIHYDVNGNRTSFAPYETTETYTTNDLSQYASRNTISAAYDFNGNLTTGLDGSTYTYDAQNRVTQATKNSVTMYFTYDGLNRQMSRREGVNGTRTYSVWDGWDLVEEYQGAGTVVAAYLHGATGLVKNLVTNNYYYQDGSGSTSHLANSDGALLEWYRYDLQGTPFFYDANNNQLSTTNYSVRHLFTGQQWYSDLGLYDLRNRFYSPDIGRFLQPDPIGFAGDSTNLYRYSGNNPVTSSDPMGLDAVPHSGGYYTYVAHGGWRYVQGLGGRYVVNAGGTYLECAGAARYLGGGYANGGAYYNMPKVGYWYQGVSISRYTTPGTIVVRNWAADGSYPNMTIAEANRLGVPINHTAVFGYIDSDGNVHLYAQNPGPIHEEVIPADQLSEWSEVRVAQGNGPYENTPSDRSVADGNGASGEFHIGTTGNIIPGPSPWSIPVWRGGWSVPGVPVWGGNWSPLTVTGGGDWTGLSPGWAAFPGPQPGEGQPESRLQPR